MPFAQLVIGPPGAGKSTYCDGMHQFLGAIGRKSSIVNLDPANDATSYPCALDVREIVTLEEIMGDTEGGSLGPNGGVLYALEEVEGNFDWLEEGLKGLGGMHYSFFLRQLRFIERLIVQMIIYCLIVLGRLSCSRIIRPCEIFSSDYKN